VLGDSGCPAPGTGPAAEPDPFAASQPSQTMAMQVGNPIHVATGNKYQREVDLQLPALGLSFVRHYNSRSRRDGAMGHGWRHAFETTLKEAGDVVRIWQADGRRIDFAPIARQGSARKFRAVQHADGQLLADAGGYEWHAQDGRVLSFDRQRVLRRIRAADGRTLHLVRDRHDRLIALRGASGGQALRLDYDRRGRLIAVRDAAGNSAAYDHDGRGNLVRARRADGTERTYHYEDPQDPHNLTGISVGQAGAPPTRLRTWAYDGADRGIASQAHDSAQHVQLDYASDHTRVTAQDGRSSIYRLAQQSGLPVVSRIDGPACDPCSAAAGGGDVHYRYNAALQLTEVLHAKGGGLRYAYDRQGRWVSVSMRTPAGEWIEQAGLSYRADSEQVTELSRPSVRPGHLRRLVLAYDADHRPVRVTEHGFAPDGEGGWQAITRTQHFAFGAQGRLSSIDGWREGKADLTRLQWLADGSARTTFADGGFLAVLMQDASGRPTRIQTESGPAIDLAYDATGQLRSARRGERIVHFDAARAAAPSSTGSVGPLPEHAMHSMTVTTRAVGGASQAHALDRFIDANGHVTRIWYDDFGRRVREDSPDRGTRRYAYTGDALLTTLTDPNAHVARFEHDAGGRLLRSSIDGVQTRYVWKGQGLAARPERVDGGDQQERSEYDAAGRLIRQEIRIGNTAQVRRHHYDAHGRRIGTILPDGRALTFRYHRDGSLFSIGHLENGKEVPIVTGIDHASAKARGAAMSGWTAFNGIATRWMHEDGKLVGLRIAHLHDFRYRYAGDGARKKIVAIDDGHRPQQRFRYDALGRLDFALTPDALYGYAYDANGTPTRITINGQNIKLGTEAGSNRVADVRADAPPWHAPLRASFAADLSSAPVALHLERRLDHQAGGEATRLGELRIAWNANGQPARIWRGESLIAEYRYNARAERIEKTRYLLRGEGQGSREQTPPQPVTTRYLYEGGRLAAEMAADGTVIRQYLYLGGHPVAILQGRETFAVHCNHLGAPIAVTDATQRVVWRARYAPFGHAQVAQDPDGDGRPFILHLRLPGQYEDEETGLHYNHHRYYDPLIGRYLSPDPLGLLAGPNPYAYAGNDPMNFIDPTGLLLFAFDGTGNHDRLDEGKGDITNVVRFRDSYLPDSYTDLYGQTHVEELPTEMGTNYYYITGAGTRDQRSGIEGGTFDPGTGTSMLDRIAYLANDFFDYLDWHKRNNTPTHLLNIDIVGFSRGAAQARIFANILGSFLDDDDYFQMTSNGSRVVFTTGKAKAARDYLNSSCLSISMRFLGLWDTVPHYEIDQNNDIRQLPMEIHPYVDNVAHAVAALEEREQFRAISIHHNPEVRNVSTLSAVPDTAKPRTRLELGFIGAHADIGGGYAEGDLSDVAFLWMVKNAKDAGVRINDRLINNRDWDVVTVPALHSSVGVQPTWIPNGFDPGRHFAYLDDESSMEQTAWRGYGMNYNLARSDDYYDERYTTIGTAGKLKGYDNDYDDDDDEVSNRTLVGLVNGRKYSAWLSQNYGIQVEINQSGLKDGYPPPTRP
jgi:RHS repeat-associated protein